MPIVTSIKSQKKDPNRVSLFIDEKFYCGLSLKIFTKHSLYKGVEITDKDLGLLVLEELEERFFKRCVDYLDRGMRTHFQITRYIRDVHYKKKGDWFDKELIIDLDGMIERILTRLEKVLLLDDEKYARAFVNGRLRSRPRSAFVLVGELMKKGVDKEIAQQVCDELIEDEYALMVKAYEKKYKEQPLYKRDNKKIDYLRRKGFKWDLISQLITDDPA